MNLCYRGVSYRATATALTATNLEVIGRYRGQTCRRSHFDIAVVHPRVTLKYRGVTYMPGVSMSDRPIGLAGLEGQSSGRLPVFGEHVQSELEKVHSRSIQNNLERRLSIARNQGNQTLVHLLEKEQEQLAS
ncbi:MAG: DUF4278 domain-containing protein [Thermosynechococcaceae cyanobacterium]